MGVAGLHDPILAAAGEGLVSFVFSCQVRVGLTMVLLLLSLLLFKSAISLCTLLNELHLDRFREKT
jgi:hypothetical protein